MNLKRINWPVIAIILIYIAGGIAIVCMICSCQRTDYQYEQGENLLYISNTSWATDSRLQEIVIDPNGRVTITGYDKQEDSLKGNYNPVTGMTVESTE